MEKSKIKRYSGLLEWQISFEIFELHISKLLNKSFPKNHRQFFVTTRLLKVIKETYINNIMTEAIYYLKKLEILLKKGSMD